MQTVHLDLVRISTVHKGKLSVGLDIKLFGNLTYERKKQQQKKHHQNKYKKLN